MSAIRLFTVARNGKFIDKFDDFFRDKQHSIGQLDVRLISFVMT